jgi:hypothetical protein
VTDEAHDRVHAHQRSLNSDQAALNAQTLAVLRELTDRLMKVEAAFVELSKSMAHAVAQARAIRESAGSTKH